MEGGRKRGKKGSEKEGKGGRMEIQSMLEKSKKGKGKTKLCKINRKRECKIFRMI